MNILMVDYEYPPIGGGGGVSNKQLAEVLASRGYNVTVLTSRYGTSPTVAFQSPDENRNTVDENRLFLQESVCK